LGFIGQSYLKITLEPIRTQKLGSLLMKLSQSNFNLRSPDSDLVRSYLIATVSDLCKFFQVNQINYGHTWQLLYLVKFVLHVVKLATGIPFY
jgi:hypothetical protein